LPRFKRRQRTTAESVLIRRGFLRIRTRLGVVSGWRRSCAGLQSGRLALVLQARVFSPQGARVGAKAVPDLMAPLCPDTDTNPSFPPR